MVNYTRRGLVVKRPGVLSKAQMLSLVIAQAPTIPLTCDLSGVLQNTKTPSSVEIRKKYEKNCEIPHFRFGPKNTKKYRKNYKNGQKMSVFLYFFRRKKYEKIAKSPISGLAPKIRKNTEKLQKRTQNVCFSVFFSYFWGQTGNGEFRLFFVIFFVVPRLRGFCIL